MISIATAVPMADVNLKGSWDKLWGAITAGFSQLTTILTVVGLILVVFAVVKYFWDRRRQGSANASPLWGALIIGAILAAPNVILPVALVLTDGIANIGVALFKNVVGS